MQQSLISIYVIIHSKINSDHLSYFCSLKIKKKTKNPLSDFETIRGKTACKLLK